MNEPCEIAHLHHSIYIAETILRGYCDFSYPFFRLYAMRYGGRKCIAFKLQFNANQVTRLVALGPCQTNPNTMS